MGNARAVPDMRDARKMLSMAGGSCHFRGNLN